MEPIDRAARDLTVASYWMEKGLYRTVAQGLARLGIRTLDDLAALTREELVASEGLGEGALKRCEALLGRPMASALPYWASLGVPRPIAWRLSRHRVMHLADLRQLTVSDLKKLGFQAYDADALVALTAQGRFPKLAL
ncbi:MAG TPA: hypothetical protein DD490_26660 [Acidobacteria bacterium]|nr:hypothetical protein [Acidobacteriota bacterium]